MAPEVTSSTDALGFVAVSYTHLDVYKRQHESEIPNPGDYVRRYIGQDSCLVVRGDDGEVNILLNVCPHRGMSICREEEGNSRGFTCPYHGWSFDKQGTFRGAPFEREMYGDLLRRESDRLVLTKARVGNISGLLFANWDPDAEDFDDYLGEFKWYILSLIHI